MKEVIVHLFCDAHEPAGDKVPATITREVAVDGHAERTIDLCEVCDKELFARLMTVIDTAGEIPEDAPPEPDRQHQTVPCEICGEDMQRHSLLGHVWGKHISGPRLRISTTCQECGEKFNHSQGTAHHLRRTHNYDPLVDAYAKARAEARP